VSLRPPLVAAVLTGSLALAGCQVAPGPTSPPASASTGGDVLRVTSVADGDTFTGRNVTGAKVKVRMLSIDAPELAHDGNKAACGSGEAAARLRALLSGQTVSLVADPRADATDRYGRRLAYVELDGRDVALQLVSEGLVEAWYPRGEPEPARFAGYADAQHAASKKRAGSWATCSNLGR
jgi:micrococcal nuclease